MNRFVLFFLIIISLPSLGQISDSLRNQLHLVAADSTKVDIYYELAIQGLSISYDSSLFYLKAAVPLLANGKEGQVAEIHNVLQFVYRRLGHYDSALSSLDIIENYNIRTNQTSNLALCYFNKGWAYKSIGDYEESMTSFVKALQNFEEAEDLSRIANTRISMGNLYLDQGMDGKALENFHLALAPAERAKDSLQISNVYTSLGIIHKNKKEYPTALDYFQKNLEIKSRLKDPGAYGRALGQLGDLYMGIGDSIKAAQYLNDALITFKAVSNYPQIARTNIMLSKVTISINLDKSLAFALDGLKLGKQINAPDIIQGSHAQLSAVYKKKRDFERSLKHYEVHQQLKDSLVNESQSKQIIELEEKYESEKKDSEIQLLNTENELNQAQLNRQENQQWFLMASLLLISAIAVLLYNRYAIKNKTARQLAEKNLIIGKTLEEKEVLMKEVHHRVKNNLQIIESLLNLQNEWGTNKSPEEILRKSQERIHAISVIHDKLYHSENLKEIDFKTYTGELISYFKETYETEKLTIDSSIEKVVLDLDQLIPCGLILNELIANSIKYGFGKLDSGVIKISGYKSGNGKYCVEVRDNGKGLKENFDPKESLSLGFKLVNSLTEQLDGVFEVIKEQGAAFKLTFTASL